MKEGPLYATGICKTRLSAPLSSLDMVSRCSWMRFRSLASQVRRYAEVLVQGWVCLISGKTGGCFFEDAGNRNIYVLMARPASLGLARI